MLNLQTFTELYALGFNPIPVIWNVEKKQVEKYPLHETDITDGKPQLHDVERWLNNGFKNFNGIALKLYPPYGMFDFDLKNTDRKGIFNEWMQIVKSTMPDVLSKVCIETTRSGGYHVYIKYEKLDHKIPVARSKNGEEVISVYTGGLLSFCYPSPNYEIIHNEFQDVDFLTVDEFEFLVSTAAYFNENQEFKTGESKVCVTDYPTEYENICLQFDYKCTDEVFEEMLNQIDLYRVTIDAHRWGRKAYIPFLRRGSTADYSAKAYFTTNIEFEGKKIAESKRLLIFSASMSKFPTWHDSAKSGDNTWSLSPSKIIFYKNDKDWTRTIEEIQIICDSAGIELAIQPPVTNQPILNEDRLKFPYDIFPDEITNYISFQKIQHEYLAGAALMAVATAIGNTVELQALQGYNVKPILYMAIVSPAGGGKSPAMTTMFRPIEDWDDVLYRQYSEKRKVYNQDLAEYKKDKNNTKEPEKPPFPQTIIKDSTIEMVIKILSENPLGCILSADELIGFLNRMNAYKSGDDVQKWLELWNGSPILLQRITRDENKVQEPFCHIIGGIQVGVLETLSKEQNEHNGFFHRFLFVYPKPETKPDWGNLNMPNVVEQDFFNYFGVLLNSRLQDKKRYSLSNEADALYAEWYNNKNKKYNIATSDQVKGIISKYQNYCLRLALIIEVMNNPDRRIGIVSYLSMERAIRLVEYFLGNMYKAIKILTPETPVDKLKPPYDDFYNQLPQIFTTKTAIELGVTFGLKDAQVKMFLQRQNKKIINTIDRGRYERIY